MYRIYRIAETIKVERVVLNALASAGVGSVGNPLAAASDENCTFADIFRLCICLSFTVTLRLHEHLTKIQPQKSAINYRTITGAIQRHARGPGK